MERKGNLGQKDRTSSIYSYFTNISIVKDKIILKPVKRNLDFSGGSWECKDPIKVSIMVESTLSSMWESSQHRSASSSTRTYKEQIINMAQVFYIWNARQKILTEICNYDCTENAQF